MADQLKRKNARISDGTSGITTMQALIQIRHLTNHLIETEEKRVHEMQQRTQYEDPVAVKRAKLEHELERQIQKFDQDMKTKKKF